MSLQERHRTFMDAHRAAVHWFINRREINRTPEGMKDYSAALKDLVQEICTSRGLDWAHGFTARVPLNYVNSRQHPTKWDFLPGPEGMIIRQRYVKDQDEGPGEILYEWNIPDNNKVEGRKIDAVLELDLTERSVSKRNFDYGLYLMIGEVLTWEAVTISPRSSERVQTAGLPTTEQVLVDL